MFPYLLYLSLIPVFCTLVILGGAHDLHDISVHEGQYGYLTACHKLLDDDLITRGAELLIHHQGLNALFASSNVWQIRTPFPSARPSAFSTIGIFAVSRYSSAFSGSVNVS